MNGIMNFFTKYGLYILGAALLLGFAIYFIVVETSPIKKLQPAKFTRPHMVDVDASDFQYLDKTMSVVEPIRTPTDNLKNHTAITMDNGSVVYEPNIMIDPVDILGEDEFENAVESIHPGVSECQLKALTTPWILKQGSVFWGTYYPPGGPGTEKYCIKPTDNLYKGVFSSHSQCGTTDEGTSCNVAN